jgi:hypothetical protein
VWLEREGVRSSTLDLFGRHFTLVTGAGGRAWAAGAVEVGGRFRVQIDAHCIDGGDYADADGSWGKQYGVSDGGAVLVRPDGHVAWRAAGECDAPAAKVLASVLGQVLARNGSAVNG